MIHCAGEALVDVLPSGDAVPGGGPMNAAVAAARLGAPTAFVGRLSTDDHGRRIEAHLLASGVDLRYVQRGPEPTARAVVETEPVQRFTFHGENTADTALTDLDLDLRSGPHLLHGGTLGIFRGATADTLAALLPEVDGVVSFDPNVRPAIIDQVGRDRWWHYADQWLARADLVRGSDEDFDWMGTDPAALLDRGARVVVQTLGADGAEVHLADGGHASVPGAEIDFVDAVGAGDSFCGALLVWIQERGWPDALDDWRGALAFAVAVAGITCSRPGADPPWRAELEEI